MWLVIDVHCRMVMIYSSYQPVDRCGLENDRGHQRVERCPSWWSTPKRSPSVCKIMEPSMPKPYIVLPRLEGVGVELKCVCDISHGHLLGCCVTTVRVLADRCIWGRD